MTKNIQFYIHGHTLNCSNIPNLQNSDFDFLELSNYLFYHHEVKHLIFSNCSINLGSMRCTQDSKYLCFANSLRMEHIESIDVSNNNFSAINFLLRGIDKVSSMKSINLSNCNITDSYVRDLVRIFNEYYPNLVELNLSNNHITNKIIEPLNTIIKNGGFSNCRILDLSGNQITYSEIKELVDVISSTPSCHIQTLKFNNDFINTEETFMLNDLLNNKQDIEETLPSLSYKEELTAHSLGLIKQLTTTTKVDKKTCDQIKTILNNSIIDTTQKNELLDILYHERSITKLTESQGATHAYYLSELISLTEDIKSTVTIIGEAMEE